MADESSSSQKDPYTEIMFLSTFATMLSSGVPVLKTLSSLEKAFPAYAPEIKTLHEDIKQGESVAGAFRKYPQSFHPIVYGAVDIGEQTGSLPYILDLSANFIEKELKYNVNSRQGPISEEVTKLFLLNYLSTLTDSGVPVTRALTLTSQIDTFAELKGDLEGIVKGIDSGKMFSEAVSASKSKYFNQVDADLIKAGELSGNLEVVLARMAKNEERYYFIRNSKK